jgi:hypothetical protein
MIRSTQLYPPLVQKGKAILEGLPRLLLPNQRDTKHAICAELHLLLGLLLDHIELLACLFLIWWKHLVPLVTILLLLLVNELLRGVHLDNLIGNVKVFSFVGELLSILISLGVLEVLA